MNRKLNNLYQANLKIYHQFTHNEHATFLRNCNVSKFNDLSHRKCFPSTRIKNKLVNEKQFPHEIISTMRKRISFPKY